MTDSLARIDGGCHCGNIRYVLAWPASDRTIPVRRCGCTFCQKHGGAWTSHRDARLAAEIVDENAASIYRFGTQTADFHICAECGVAPLVVSEIDGDLYAVVNVNSFGDIGEFELSESATNFDGEDTGSRLERRKRNWIQHVRLGIS